MDEKFFKQQSQTLRYSKQVNYKQYQTKITPYITVHDFLHVCLVPQPVTIRVTCSLPCCMSRWVSFRYSDIWNMTACWITYSQPCWSLSAVVNTHTIQKYCAFGAMSTLLKCSHSRKAKTLIYSSKCADRPGDPFSLLTDGDWRALSPWVKPSERDADDSPPYSAKLNNVRRYNFTSLNAFTACIVIA
jgi:hypothetical protein